MKSNPLRALLWASLLGLSACGGGGGGVANTAPTANFAFVCSDLACTFTNTSTDPESNASIASYKWSFGDASSDVTTRNATHTYAAAGSFDVVLVVVDNLGASGTVTQKVMVTAPAAGSAVPHASFTAACESLTCTFTDTSTYDAGSTPSTRLWNFGDGVTLAATNPAVHRYGATTLTTYTVTLTVTDAAGNTSTNTQSLPVAPPASTDNCTGENCRLLLTQAATVTATLVSSACNARGNQFLITAPINEVLFTDGCYVPVGSTYTLNGGAQFAAGTQLQAAVVSGLTGTTGLAFPPSIRVSGNFSTGWTLSFDDGAGGPGEPDYDDLVILIKPTP